MAEINLSAFDRFAADYSPGQIIFCEYEAGDQFFLLQKGRVKLLKVIGEIERTVSVLQVGDFFGEMALIEETPRSATAVALEECRLLEFNKRNFEILATSNPQMGIKLLKLFAQRIYDQKRRNLVLLLDDDAARVSDVLVMLSESSNVKETDGICALPASVDDVAHWAGLSAEAARRALSSFVAQKRIDIYPDHILVKNINEFKRFVAAKRRASSN